MFVLFKICLGLAVSYALTFLLASFIEWSIIEPFMHEWPRMYRFLFLLITPFCVGTVIQTLQLEDRSDG